MQFDEPTRAPVRRLLTAITLLTMALRAPRMVTGDTWFTLVLGREIAANGLITRNNLTHEGWGADWVDQQWLAHIANYALMTHVGLPSVGFVAWSFTCGSLLIALWSGISRAVPSGRVVVFGSAAVAVVAYQAAARAQALTLPFFVGFLLMLSADVRAPRAKTWALVPSTVVWANLHGSVLLAPVMAGLLLVGRVLDAWRRGEVVSRRLVGRDALLATSLFAAVFVSPYAARLPSYYRATLGNAAFREYIGEWNAPDWAVAVPVMLLVVALPLVAMFRDLSTFESLLCALLGIGTLSSIRYGTPLALVVAAILLPAVDAPIVRRLFPFAVDRFLATGSRILMAISIVTCPAIFVTAEAFSTKLPTAFTDRVALAMQDDEVAFIDEHQADRLLWFHPELKGRVSHDARVETSSIPFLEALSTLYGSPDAPGSQRFLSRYRVAVVDRSHPVLFRWFNQDSGWSRLAADTRADLFVRRDASSKDPVTGERRANELSDVGVSLLLALGDKPSSPHHFFATGWSYGL